MKLDISQRGRFALYAHLNQQTLAGHAEERKFMHAWEALRLDEIVSLIDGKGGAMGSNDCATEVETIEIDSSDRDFLIEQLDKPKPSGLARQTFPIAAALRKSRDG